MSDNRQDGSPSTDRRGFLGRAAAASAALGVAATTTGLREALASPVQAPSAADSWLKGLKGKYRQVFDAHDPNDGFGLAYAHTFLATHS